MTQNSDIQKNGNNDSENKDFLKLEADSSDKMNLPDGMMIGDADFSRDGQDLILEFSNGPKVVAEGYFSGEQDMMIGDSSGAVLTSGLVNSFLSSSPQYAQNASMTDESPIGAVEEIKGQATITRLDGTSETATIGTPIYQGDVVQTNGNGALNITFIDETSMAISQNARIAIDNYEFDAATESGKTDLSVLRGVFVYTSGLIGRDDPDDVEINTPVGSIGIRGTIIAGHINPDGQSKISVLEGAIVVTNGAGERTLSQQYETVKLSGFKNPMEYQGVEAAENIGKTYGSVSDVLPKLFSSINDAAQEQSKSNDAKQEESKDDIDAAKENKEESKQEESKEDIDASQQDSELEIVEENAEFAKADAVKIDGDAKEKEMGKGHGRHADLQSLKDGSFVENPLFQKIREFSNKADNNVTSQPFDAVLLNATNGQTGLTGYTVAENISGGLEGRGPQEAILNDFNGDRDGNSDYAILPSGNIHVGDIYGQNGLLEYNSTLPSPDIHHTSIASIGDLNNDGYTDLIAGAENNNNTYGGYTVVPGNTTTVVLPFVPGTSAGDNYGHAVIGLGDFDGDGKSDYAITAPGEDGFSSELAGQNGVFLANNEEQTNNKGTITIKSSGVSGTYDLMGQDNGDRLGEHLAGIGDFNNDGLSDLIVAGTSKSYIVYGQHNFTGDFYRSVDNTTPDEVTELTSSNLGTLKGVYTVGDMNGDGFDDVALSYQNGGNIDTYVVYGKDGDDAGANIDITDSANALKITQLNASGEYQVTAVGDVNGDGFDDLRLGVLDEDQYIVHGKAGTDVVTDGSNDADSNNDAITAGSNGKSLAGNAATFNDGTVQEVSMRGGNGNNTFQINNAAFKNIDGGKGIDTIELQIPGSALDFTHVKFEQISQIEQIKFGSTNQIMTLTAENIFNLLKSSDTHELKIMTDGMNGTKSANGIFRIDADTSGSNNDGTSIIAALNERGTGAMQMIDQSINGQSYHTYQIGGYKLYIDTDIQTEVVQ